MPDETEGPTEELTGPERLLLTVAFPALSPEELFDLWVRAECVTRWWPPVAEIEPQLHGKYHLSWPSMNWILRGEVTRLERPRRFGFSWRWDHEPETPTTEVMIDIDRASHGSRIHLVHGPYPDSEEGRQMRQVHLDGWMYFLPRLQALPREA